MCRKCIGSFLAVLGNYADWSVAAGANSDQPKWSRATINTHHSPPASLRALPSDFFLSQLLSALLYIHYRIHSHSDLIAYHRSTNSTHYQVHYPSSCLPRKPLLQPLPPKRPLPTPLTLHTRVSFSIIPAAFRVLLLSFESRTNADHFNIDMIKDAIINVSTGTLRQLTSSSPRI